MVDETKTVPARKTGPAITKEEPVNTQAAGLLTDFIAFRRQQLAKQVGPPGINRSAAAAIIARDRENVLAELSALADWLSSGCPKSTSVLSEVDRAFWKDAKERGLTVPKDIADQI